MEALGIQGLLSLRWALPPYSGALLLLQKLPHELRPCLSACQRWHSQVSLHSPYHAAVTSVQPRDSTLLVQCPLPWLSPGLSAHLHFPRSLESIPSPVLSWPQLLHLQNGLKTRGQGKLRKTRSQGFGFKSRVCDCWQGSFSLWALAMGRGVHPASCVSPQIMVRPRGVLGWRSSASYQAPVGRMPSYLAVGAWAWLCDLEQRPLLLWPQSSRPHSGNGRELDSISQAALPITAHIPHGHLPSLSGCFGCEASVAAPLLPIPSTAWLSCSFPRSFCLSLLPPPSLPLLSRWALAFSSLLCVSGPPLQPDLVHIQMAAKVLHPLPPPTQAQGTQPCGGAPPAPSSSPLTPPGALV